MRRSILVALAAVVAGSCSDAFPEGTPCEPPADEGIVICLRAAAGGDDGPDVRGTMLAGDRSIEGLFGGSEWEIGGVLGHGDPGQQRVSDFTFVDADAGTGFRIAGNAEGVRGSLAPVTEDADGYASSGERSSVRFVDGTTRIDAEPGRYILTIEGDWADGHQSFRFGLLIKG